MKWIAGGCVEDEEKPISSMATVALFDGRLMMRLELKIEVDPASDPEPLIALMRCRASSRTAPMLSEALRQLNLELGARRLDPGAPAT